MKRRGTLCAIVTAVIFIVHIAFSLIGECVHLMDEVTVIVIKKITRKLGH